MNIAIAGTGYVGLVTGVCLASLNNQVTCIDVDVDKVTQLKAGKPMIYEEGLLELMQEHADKLTFTLSEPRFYQDKDIIYICVGTPEKKDGSANTKYIFDCVRQICEGINRECIIVVKSTVPIGTNERIEKMARELVDKNILVHVASNPEFLSQGTAIYDTFHATRIVLGVNDKYSERQLSALYQPFNCPIVITNRPSAEMIKYASNDFLALKISYINEIANICELIGANIDDVSRGMSYDPRIGSQFLNAGIGYGGSCFPKDTKALHWLASMHDYEIKTIKAAIEVNSNQKLRLIKKARKYYDSFSGLKIAVLGLSFKPFTDDIREAPSLANIPILVEEGASIFAWDPVGEEQFKKQYTDPIHYCDTIDEAITEADLCLIFTEWEQIKSYDLSKYASLMNRAVVVDGRNCYQLDEVKKYEITYESIGRASIDAR